MSTTQTTPFQTGYTDGANGCRPRQDSPAYMRGYEAGADANSGAYRPTFNAGIER